MISMENKIVYIRMKKKITSHPHKRIKLEDVAHLTANHRLDERMKQFPIYRLTDADREFVVIDSYHIIHHLNNHYPGLEFQLIGFSETVITVERKTSRRSILFITFVWMILFIGTAMTIINFHYDVSMQEVHQRIHYLFTGEQKTNPLWIQIPYSFGLGIGMILFLNHWFKKRLNEEPSPLEVELFKYQQSIDEYVAYYENDLNDGKRRF